MSGTKREKNTIALILAAAGSLLLIVGLLFTSLQLIMNQPSFYSGVYDKLGQSRHTGISTDDMTRAIMQLIDYMEGRADGIQIAVIEDGVSVDMYNAREIAHMEDVQKLYMAWRGVRNWGMAAAAVIIAALAVIYKRDCARPLIKGFLIASGVFLAALIALGAWVLIDFNSFWTAFHLLFFDNDLWLLSWATDRMIRICPIELFYDIVTRFGLLFIGAYAALLAGALIWRRAYRRGHKEGGEADGGI